MIGEILGFLGNVLSFLSGRKTAQKEELWKRRLDANTQILEFAEKSIYWLIPLKRGNPQEFYRLGEELRPYFENFVNNLYFKIHHVLSKEMRANFQFFIRFHTVNIRSYREARITEDEMSGIIRILEERVDNLTRIAQRESGIKP